MKITINRREVIIFPGANVLDVVRSYSMRSSKLLEKGILVVFDQFGNKTETDGELTEGQKLFLKKEKHEEV